MRTFRFSVVAAAMLFAGFTTTKAQTADEIIQKHVTAIGGLDNWKKITSIKSIGSINAGGTEIPVTTIVLNGKGARMEVTMNGMTGYQIMTTKDGWGYFPMYGQKKPEAVPADMVEQLQDGLDVQGPLVDYKAKGNIVVYLGKDQVEGTECYKLQVTYKNGKEETIYLDASNYYHIRTVDKIKANGKEEETIVNYSNYQKLPEGIVVAMTTDEGMGAITFKTIEVNKPVDESIFKPGEPTNAVDSKK